jgi:type II secretory ATPase GspE/PulE/Tfp pilus assembly ATPase PilB-like protein
MMRLKVVSKLTVFRHDVPQEGRIVAKAHGRSVDLRVSILPTIHGEKVTVRLFDPDRGLFDLQEIGFQPEMQEQFQSLLNASQGTLLLTGPSNSGKTTTLYAALRSLHDTHHSLSSIATVEDPVEYDLQVINQTQTNPAVGLTFAAGLRTVLRQDPEVIMIGEIRDQETAEIAIRAGLTGHLILSTVHARSAPGVFVRLLDIGVEPFLVASSVTGVLSQRLVRTICPDCAQPDDPSPELRAKFSLDGTSANFRRGAGCAHCHGTGFAGRTGIFELLVVTDALREKVLQKATVGELERQAREAGAATLADDGVAKAGAGVTTLDEVARVCGI